MKTIIKHKIFKIKRVSSVSIGLNAIETELNLFTYFICILCCTPEFFSLTHTMAASVMMEGETKKSLTERI